jgi:SAM-dependent methyltransferase
LVKKIAKLLNKVKCNICSSDSYENVYKTKHFINEEVGKIKITNVMCNDCGFVYTNPRLSKKYFINHYNDSSSGDVYHESGQNTRHGIVNRERKLYIEKYINLNANGDFLDVGCGQGDLLKTITAKGWNKYGLEPSNAAKRKKLKGIKIFDGFIDGYDFRGKLFDAISCISSLEHFYNPDKVLKIISKILSTNGLLFLEVPDSIQPEVQISDFYSFEHISHFTKYSLSLILKNNGFQVIGFDKNMSLRNIRCVAEKSEKVIINLKDDRISLKKAIVKYINDRAIAIDSISKKIIPDIEKINRKNGNLAVYGAGEHTKFLHEKFDFISNVFCYFDSDPQKWGNTFLGKKVYQPNKVDIMDISAILISSHDYEDEILNTINKYNSNNIPVIRCYGN